MQTHAAPEHLAECTNVGSKAINSSRSRLAMAPVDSTGRLGRAPDTRYSQKGTAMMKQPESDKSQRPGNGQSGQSKTAACVKVGPVWITIGPRIEAELAAMKKFVEDVSRTVKADKVETAEMKEHKERTGRRPSLPFEPAARSRTTAHAEEGKAGKAWPARPVGGVDLAAVPRSQAVSSGVAGALLLHYDKPSGLLFQMPSSDGRGMAFTATERPGQHNLMPKEVRTLRFLPP